MPPSKPTPVDLEFSPPGVKPVCRVGWNGGLEALTASSGWSAARRVNRVRTRLIERRSETPMQSLSRRWGAGRSALVDTPLQLGDIQQLDESARGAQQALTLQSLENPADDLARGS